MALALTSVAPASAMSTKACEVLEERRETLAGRLGADHAAAQAILANFLRHCGTTKPI